MFTDLKPFSMMGLPNKISCETPAIQDLHAMLKRDFFQDKEESVVSVKIKLQPSPKEEEEEEEDGGCTTPKAVDHKMSVSLKCPPPPRKPKSLPSAKRKAQRVLLDLSNEIDSLFPSIILRDFMCGKINKVRKLTS